MEKITLKELNGYQEDIEGHEKFVRKYRLFMVFGFVVVIGGVVAGLVNESLRHHRWIFLGILVVGVLIIAGSMIWNFFSTPFCPGTRTKMEKYWNASPVPGELDVIYVDRIHKTYFRCVYVIQNPKE